MSNPSAIMESIRGEGWDLDRWGDNEWTVYLREQRAWLTTEAEAIGANADDADIEFPSRELAEEALAKFLLKQGG